MATEYYTEIIKLITLMSIKLNDSIGMIFMAT